MKAIILTIIVLTAQSAYSQSDKKPSWTEAMPERNEAPEMDIDHAVNTEIDLGLERDALFTDENEFSQGEDEAAANLEKDRIQKEKIANEQAVEQQRIEDQRIAELQEKEKLAADKLAAEKLAAENLAAEKLAAENLAAEQLVTDSIPSETLTVENIPQEDSNNDVEIPPVGIETIQAVRPNYSWKKISNAAPEYPGKAFRLKKEGWVEVELTIDPQGDVIDTKVVKTQSGSTFNEAATKAIRKWKFEPPADFGINESQKTTVRIAFNL